MVINIFPGYFKHLKVHFYYASVVLATTDTDKHVNTITFIWGNNIFLTLLKYCTCLYILVAPALYLHCNAFVLLLCTK